MFNKDLEEIRKSQSIMNNAITEIKSTLQGTNSRISEAEDTISEVEDRMAGISEAEWRRRIKKKKIRTTSETSRTTFNASTVES